MLNVSRDSNKLLHMSQLVSQQQWHFAGVSACSSHQQASSTMQEPEITFEAADHAAKACCTRSEARRGAIPDFVSLFDPRRLRKQL